MKHTIFTGCSYTAGTGFKEEKNESCLWVNQLYRAFFSDTVKINAATGGRSNTGIFQDTVKNLIQYPAKYAFVEWTSYPRYEIELGLELYTTRQLFSPNCPCQDHNLNDINYSAEYLNSVRDRMVSLTHPYYGIKQLIEYTNIIQRVATLTNTRVFFINGLLPWDQDFFVRKTVNVPSEYTEYTQKILNVSNRDDEESFALYKLMHDHFDQDINIATLDWLNLYQSQINLRIDINLDGLHPGPKSNDLYYKLFSQRLIELL
jgi:hypothetical protein